MKRVGLAIAESDSPTLEKYRESGFDLSGWISEEDRWNALHLLLKSQTLPVEIDMVNYLLEQGVDVNTHDVYGNTPLHYAARGKRANIIRRLLEAGADVDAAGEGGVTPLRVVMASRPPCEKCMEILLDYGANQFHTTPGGVSVREHASRIAALDKEYAHLVDILDKYL